MKGFLIFFPAFFWTAFLFAQNGAGDARYKEILRANRVKFSDSYQLNVDGSGKLLPDSSKYSASKYDQEGNILGMLIFPGEISFLYFYDTLGRASDMVQSNGKGTGLYKYIYVYSKNTGLLVTENIYSPLEKTYSKISYTYGFRRRLKKAVRHFGSEKYITRYTYGGVYGKRVRKEMFLNRKKGLRIVTLFTYDSQGNCIQTHTHQKGSKGKKVVYRYDVNGLLREEVREDSKGMPALVYRYYYGYY